MTSSQTQVPIKLGDLVKLKQPRLFMHEKSNSPPYMGIVSTLRDSAGMPESISYASVIWDNGNYTEHYVSDLVKVEQ